MFYYETNCMKDVWARSPMQDLGVGPLWAVVLWRHRAQSTVLRSW